MATFLATYLNHMFWKNQYQDAIFQHFHASIADRKMSRVHVRLIEKYIAFFRTASDVQCAVFSRWFQTWPSFSINVGKRLRDCHWNCFEKQRIFALWDSVTFSVVFYSSENHQRLNNEKSNLGLGITSKFEFYFCNVHGRWKSREICLVAIKQKICRRNSKYDGQRRRRKTKCRSASKTFWRKLQFRKKSEVIS